MDARIICPMVPITETKRLLNMYRANGTLDAAIKDGSCLKLSIVGFTTKKRGG